MDRRRARIRRIIDLCIGNEPLTVGQIFNLPEKAGYKPAPLHGMTTLLLNFALEMSH
jgi:hypothetical protein